VDSKPSPITSLSGVLGGLAQTFLQGGNSLGLGRALSQGINMYSKKNAHSRGIGGAERGNSGDVVMFSGCRDDQTSMDANMGGLPTGAMSYSLMEALSKGQGRHLSYAQLLKDTRSIMQGQFRQVPQLSTGRAMDMDQPFTI